MLIKLLLVFIFFVFFISFGGLYILGLGYKKLIQIVKERFKIRCLLYHKTSKTYSMINSFYRKRVKNFGDCYYD